MVIVMATSPEKVLEAVQPRVVLGYLLEELVLGIKPSLHLVKSLLDHPDEDPD
jgi:hypothetical protein